MKTNTSKIIALVLLTATSAGATGNAAAADAVVVTVAEKAPLVGYSASTADDAEDRDRDLEAKLAEARARLEQAAHEVAELSSEMGRPLINKFVFDSERPPRAVIGVQLDPASGNEGARIAEVSPGGAADEAGLRAGDVITRLNGTDVKGDGTARQVVGLMRKIEPESKVDIRVTRDGKQRDFVVTARRGVTFLGMREPVIPPIPPIPANIREFDGRFGPVFIHGPLGDMELATLTPQLGRYFGTDKGVLVVRAPKDFKLEDGDVILSIDGREPTSGSHATRILSSYQPGEKVVIKVMRQQKTLSVETTLPERDRFFGTEPGPVLVPGPGRPGSDRARDRGRDNSSGTGSPGDPKVHIHPHSTAPPDVPPGNAST